MNKSVAFLASFALLVVGPMRVFAAPAVSDADFKVLVEKYLDSKEGKKKVAENVQGYFQELQMEEAKKQQEQAKLRREEQLKNPTIVEIGTSPVKGNASAKVTIIEFSDFQCPFCKRGKEVVDQIAKLYPNDVKIAFKHLPLPMHPQAIPAAKASTAAQKQGKFWEFHDALFDNQQALKPEFYLAKAKDLGLDVEKFKKDMESPEVQKQVDDDMALAQTHGIRGTPGFFVGGVQVEGAQPVSVFEEIIKARLAEKK